MTSRQPAIARGKHICPLEKRTALSGNTRPHGCDPNSSSNNCRRRRAPLPPRGFADTWTRPARWRQPPQLPVLRSAATAKAKRYVLHRARDPLASGTPPPQHSRPTAPEPGRGATRRARVLRRKASAANLRAPYEHPSSGARHTEPQRGYSLFRPECRETVLLGLPEGKECVRSRLLLHHLSGTDR